MIGEIDKDFYCSCITYGKLGDRCYRFKDDDGFPATCKKINTKGRCDNYNRKYPTPEQFKEEHGVEWTGAVYYLDTDTQCYGENGEQPYWNITSYEVLQEQCGREINKEIIICACTPWGKPPDDWRPVEL